MKEIFINGVITVPESVEDDVLIDQLIAFFESKGYTFGGSLSVDCEEDENES